MKYKVLIILAALISLNSCFDEESPIAPYPRGNAQTGTVGMGKSYINQLYFDLGTNSEVKSNDFRIWDLAFSCRKDQPVIFLNSAKFMKLYNFGNINFVDITDDMIDSIQEEDWKYDMPSGFYDSTAIDKWWKDDFISKGEIYVLDMGIDEIGREYGYKLLKIVEFDGAQFTIQYANKGSAELQTMTIKINTELNFIHASLAKGGEVMELEPPTNDWDLLFTRYTELLYTNEGIPQWYTVTSATLNPYHVQAALDEEKDYTEIKFDDIDSYIFSNARNAVGHDWKWFDLNGSESYIIKDYKNWIIRDTESFFYKLHFIDFYNDSGDKGFPKFEFQKL